MRVTICISCRPLALAGTIPFIAVAVLPLLGHDSLPYLGPLDQLVSSYGLAIVCPGQRDR